MGWLRNPLLQFGAIGLVLFGLWYGLNRDSGGEAVIISAAQIQQIADNYEKTFLRPPKPDELHALVRNEIRSELAYREAKRLNLDQGDRLVKQRMRQKIEFLAQEVSAAETISNEDLTKFFTNNKDRYEQEAMMSFEHVFIDPDRHAMNTPQRIGDIKRAIGDGKDPTTLGDPLLLAFRQKQAPISKISNSFGQRFAQTLVDTKDVDWFGPVESAYGLHLVRIINLRASRYPELPEIADQLRVDLLRERQSQALDALYRRLQASYPVIIEEHLSVPSNTSNGGAQ